MKNAKKVLVLLCAVAVLLPTAFSQLPRLTEEKVDVKVNRTFVKGDEYFVYTDVDTFVFEDSFAYFNFFPDEDWGKIKENSCYTFTTIGYRIKLPLVGVNLYENVVRTKEIPCKQ